jgi:hypothetical protein
MLTDDGLSFIRRNTQLRYVDFDFCARFTDEGIKIFASSCSLLEELHLDSCNKITDQGLLYISQVLEISSISHKPVFSTSQSLEYE